MPRTRFATFVLALLLAGSWTAHPARAQHGTPAHGAESSERAAPDESLDALYQDVGYLSSDALEGRGTGTPGAERAARYLARRFEALGLAPGADGSWFQPFSFRHSANPHAPAGDGDARTGRNVVGWLDNGAEGTVVVGAHYDHLGYGGPGSRTPGDAHIHNGADDNASGVAALLDIARRLQASEATASNYLFVAFSGEELGLHGSKYFVQALPVPVEDIRYMVNLDMVGRLGEGRRLVVSGTGTSPAWADALGRAASATNLTLATDASGIGASDHTSFYLAEIPAVHLFTGAHDDYHTPTDDAHRIDYAGLRDVAAFATRTIEALDETAGENAIAFTETRNERSARDMSFEVSLRIMPDYAYDGEGLRIDAVIDGGPADQAGLEAGDVVVRLGETDVTDIYAYMDALKAHEAGETARVVVQRGEERLVCDVRL